MVGSKDGRKGKKGVASAGQKPSNSPHYVLERRSKENMTERYVQANYYKKKKNRRRQGERRNMETR